MNLEKILAISGKPGLYELKIQTRTGFVAESMSDGKRITVSMKSNVSLLSEISVYTYAAEKPLVEILKAMAVKENCQQAISHKSENNVLLDYVIQIMPDYDKERVYPSDIKKILNWYNTLQAKGLITIVDDKSEATIATDESVSEDVAPTTEVKKSKAKK